MADVILINGPYNGRQIEDSGTVIVSMSVYDGGYRVGAKLGTARYEPSVDRRLAFWEGNTWHGELLGIIE
jgi:hypothetical protein